MRKRRLHLYSEERRREEKGVEVPFFSLLLSFPSHSLSSPFIIIFVPRARGRERGKGKRKASKMVQRKGGGERDGERGREGEGGTFQGLKV